MQLYCARNRWEIVVQFMYDMHGRRHTEAAPKLYSGSKSRRSLTLKALNVTKLRVQHFVSRQRATPAKQSTLTRAEGLSYQPVLYSMIG